MMVAAALIGSLILVGFSASKVFSDSSPANEVCRVDESAWCIVPRTQKSISDLAGATVPRLATPAWMSQQEQASPESRVVNYEVQTRGNVTASVDEFRQQANSTLNDPRGWSKLGVLFREVDTGGDFTLWLAEASTMTTFSPEGCDTTYSCRVGRDVIINQDRWLQSSPPWLDAGGTLRDYRHMVVNHEVGHWLGHGHRYCEREGAFTPVMQQSSMDMQGCQPNAWPQSHELYAPNLGIRS